MGHLYYGELLVITRGYMEIYGHIFGRTKMIPISQPPPAHQAHQVLGTTSSEMVPSIKHGWVRNLQMGLAIGK